MGKKSRDTIHAGCLLLLAQFAETDNPRQGFPLRLWFPKSSELGREKCYHLLAIAHNNNFKTGANILEGLMLELKLQYLGHLMRRTDSLETPWSGKDWRWEEKGMTEDEMVGCHHQLKGHEFKQTQGIGDGLVCCSPCKSDTTKRLNWAELNHLWVFTRHARLERKPAIK